MFERYTERARRVIFFARYEASMFGSTTIETEHLLLGLLREDRNLISRFLGDVSVDIRREVTERLPVRERVSTAVDLPLTDACKRILSYAAEESGRLNHRHIGTEHLLLGILREEKSLAAEVLYNAGFKLEAIRQQLALSPMPPESGGASQEMRSLLTFLHSPAIPKSGVAPNEETAKQIAVAVWTPLYGAETVA